MAAWSALLMVSAMLGAAFAAPAPSPEELPPTEPTHEAAAAGELAADLVAPAPAYTILTVSPPVAALPPAEAIPAAGDLEVRWTVTNVTLAPGEATLEVRTQGTLTRMGGETGVLRYVIANGSAPVSVRFDDVALPAPASAATSKAPLVPGASASSAPVPAPTAPAPSVPAPQVDPGRAPMMAAPGEFVGIRRPLGLLQAMRDVLATLLAMLKAVGALLLYHRVSRADALDHPLRARILEVLGERPGIHVAALAEAVDAHAKTVAYHLRVLARLGSVRLAPEGRVVRAWPSAAPPVAPPESGTRARVLELLREGAAADRDRLAEILGVTPQAMSYHLKILRRDGRVRVRWLGRHREYEAA